MFRTCKGNPKMFNARVPGIRPIFLCLSLIFLSMSPLSLNLPCGPAACAADGASATQLPVSKAVSLKALEKFQTVSVTVEEEGKKVKYAGVPLRVILAELMPDLKMDTREDWKAMSYRELIMEILGQDGYPGLVTGLEIAFNKGGDRYVLATQKNGKPIEEGVHLICKADEAHSRWVKQVVSIKVVSIAKK